MNITTRKALRTVLLPGILPRVRDLFGSGFSYLSLFIAQVFFAVRLLPANHPYLNHANTGRFGIRHVISEARRNLVFKWDRLDQIIVFFLIIIGIFMLLGQFALLVFALFTQAAHASLAAYYASFFVTALPNNDIAFMTLDRVFGIPGMFQSKVDVASFDGPFPSPFHTGLHTLLMFYSIGIFTVAIILILYFAITIVGETAESGTPFGKRFNPWFGLRFVIAIAALAPIYMGMSLGQLTVLRMAKLGSSVATNGWIYFNNALTGETLGGTPAQLVSIPNEPDINTLIEFMSVVQTCKIAEDKMHNRTIEAYLVYNNNAAARAFSGSTFIQALADSGNNNFIIRFGIENAVDYPLEKGNVAPICGELNFLITDAEEDGAMSLQSDYYDFIDTLWTDGLIFANANNMALRLLPMMDKDPFALMPDAAYITAQRSLYMADIASAISAAVTAQIASGKWAANTTDRGWAGAAIWYNLIAQLNGGLIASARNLPTPALYPAVMEQVKEQRKAADEQVTPHERYKPYLSDGTMVDFYMPEDMYISVLLYSAQALWFDKAEIEASGNILIDMVNMIFGTKGIFDIIENTNIHPLAQIVAIGRGLIESAIVNLGFAFGGFVAGGLGNIFGDFIGVLGKVVAGFSTKIAMIGLSLGFILFYVVPFMPFLYFFFAFGGWIKSIFEAIVGIPLWALSLIRIDGEGIPGPNGMNGIWLVFEIFLRPILIIFGFIAAVVIFSALVKTLHEIWYLVVTNLTGNDMATVTPTGPGSIAYYRHPIDQFFYTILYAIVVYVIGMSCFKLIDAIPNTMLRWMGQSVQTFQESDRNPAESIVQTLFGGTQAVMGQASGAFGSLLGRNR